MAYHCPACWHAPPRPWLPRAVRLRDCARVYAGRICGAIRAPYAVGIWPGHCDRAQKSRDMPGLVWLMGGLYRTVGVVAYVVVQIHPVMMHGLVQFPVVNC